MAPVQVPTPACASSQGGRHDHHYRPRCAAGRAHRRHLDPDHSAFVELYRRHLSHHRRPRGAQQHPSFHPLTGPMARPAARKSRRKSQTKSTGAARPGRAARPKAAKTPSHGKPKWVYAFGGGKAAGRADMRGLLGGKGAGLAEMANLGLPVPPGFTITTEVCTHYYANGKSYPKELERQVEAGLAHIA